MRPHDPTLSVAADSDPNQTSPLQLADEAARIGPNTVVGDYEILAEIAHGGMGVVYKARQAKLNRIVALKMTRAVGPPSDLHHQRFRAEAEAAAKLDHPHIVPIYEVGEADGLQFISMAFVEGQSLGERVAAGPLPPREAAALIRQVAHAVAYAHAHGVIHRDLKPGNIMLDAAGQPRVTDFGLAKRTDADSSLTQAGQVMGTPNYMPPEQAEGRNDQVGPLADVYALGATLYCLVTGRPPFQAANVLETLKQVVEREPVAPRSLNHSVDRDLNTIALKCLQKRPEKRYDSATALAEDLQRFLERRPILARPVGDVEKLARWCRRNPAMAASLAGVVGIFLTALALISWSYVRAENARRAEAKQRMAADEARDTAQREQEAERWGRYRANIAAASGALQLQNSGTARSALDDAPPEHRDWEWRYLHNQLDGATLKLSAPGGKMRAHVLSPSGRQIALCCLDHNEAYFYDVATGRETAVLRGHSAAVTFVAYRPNGRQVATVGDDQTIRLWDPATGRQTALLRAEAVPPQPDRKLVVAYNSDGSRIVSHSTTEDGACAIRLWDAVAGREIAVLAPWTEGIVPVAFSADGRRVAAGSGNSAHVYDAVTGRRLSVLGPLEKRVRRLAFSSDGKRIAVAMAEGSSAIHLWNGENGQEAIVLRGHASSLVGWLAFSPDGSRLMSASDFPDSTARLWDAATGRPMDPLAGHKNGIDAIAFSPDGERVATASLDQTARLWDARTGRPVAVLGGHTSPTSFVVFSPDGRRVVTASDDATLRLWKAETGELISVLRGHGDGFPPYCAPAFTPDGARLVSGSKDGTVRIWDMNLLERNGILTGHGSFVYDVAFSPDGDQVASVAWDGFALLWDATTGGRTGQLKHESKVLTSVAYSRDGRRLATMERDRGITLWDTSNRKVARDLPSLARGFADNRACFNPAGTLVASGSLEGLVLLWDVALGREVARLAGHEKRSIDVAFHPDGSLLAATGEDGTVRLWDVATRAPVAVLRGHADVVRRVAFSADGKLLASCSDDKTIRLWDAQTHQALEVIPAGSLIYCVAFSPDGTRLAAGCRDNTIRLIDVATRQQVAELRGHTDYVHAVAWSPDGTRLVSGSGDFTVRVWDSLSAQERAKRSATK